MIISVSEGFLTGGGGRGGGRLPDFIDGGRGGGLGDLGGEAEAKCGGRGGFGDDPCLTSAASGLTNEWRSGGTGDCRISTTASCTAFLC